MDPREQLVAEFPELFDHMTFKATGGMAIGDGWLPLIREIAPVLVQHQVKAVQVKEKFGTLRFYVQLPKRITQRAASEVYRLVAEAEKRSCATCEDCGAEGQQVTPRNYWIRTLCDSCLTRAKAA